MIKNYISILKPWNFWNSTKINTGVSRPKYLKKLVNFLDIPEVVALFGVRRSGKSTLLLQIIDYLHKKKVPTINTLYINFEDPGLGEKITALDLFEILEQYQDELKPKKRIYLFLDEIQHVQQWQKFVRTIYDQRRDIKIFLTGSSSSIFETKLSTVLSGRMLPVKIKPLDFKEFLRFKQVKKNSKKIHDYLDEYLTFGGFPRVVLEKNKVAKKAILVSYYNTIIEKDVINLHQIRQKTELKQLARLVFSNVGNQISSYKLKNVLKISHVTIQKHLEYLKDAYLIDLIPQFSYSVKNQIYNPDKIFVVDLGLANTAGFSFSKNKGKLVENLVFQHLEERVQDIFYWHNGTEIDLVTRLGLNVDELINVTLTVDEPAVLEREIKSLQLAKKHFQQAKTSLYTLYNQSGAKQALVKNVLDLLLDS